MENQQNHLQQLVEQYNNLIAEINSLNNQITSKKELSLKVLGVIEYLEQLGVTLPTKEDMENENQQEEVKKEESTEEKQNPQ